MIFSSVDFFVFFAIVLLLYRVLPHRAQNVMLLVTSYVFYAWWNWRYLFLLLLASLTDAYAAQRIAATENRFHRKCWLLVTLSMNLGVLCLFKYFNFFIDSAAGVLDAIGLQAHLPTLRLILPVGISFFTFQSMSYVIDVYRRQTPAVPVFYHLLFSAFFPQLVAGPIERHRHMIPQYVQPRKMTAEGAYRGVLLILWGLFKKLALADNLAPYVDAVYSNVGSHSGATVALATYLFAFQIYCDFSGYSDMAVGMGRIMGVDFMFNFRAPYLARNVQEFWRRWHISLSTWFRDYLYLPLGGSVLRRCANTSTSWWCSWSAGSGTEPVGPSSCGAPCTGSTWWAGACSGSVKDCPARAAGSASSSPSTSSCSRGSTFAPAAGATPCRCWEPSAARASCSWIRCSAMPRFRWP